QRLELGELLLSTSVVALQLFNTSAKTGTGVHKAFDWMVQRLHKVLPGRSNISIRKIVVYNNSAGIPVTESNNKLEKDIENLEWKEKASLVGENSTDEPIDDATVILSGIVTAVDMMSQSLGASYLQSITLKNNGEKNLIVVKENLDDITCIILCQEGDDLFLIRDLGRKILEWVNREKTKAFKPIGRQKFTEKLEELVQDLCRVTSED
ncbi:MAG: hypothetical protein ACFFD4_40860, partial [Candidatus Odinarchaeota archaeon]